MVDPLHYLFDDGAFVQVAGNVVRCGPDQFYAPFKGLMVWLGALETRQERVMNVDGLAGQLPAQIVREHLHVAGKDQQVAASTELGVLDVQGAWRLMPHNLKLRQEILKEKGNRRSQTSVEANPIEEYVQCKLAKAKGTRRATSNIAALLGKPVPVDQAPLVFGASMRLTTRASGTVKTKCDMNPPMITLGSK